MAKRIKKIIKSYKHINTLIVTFLSKKKDMRYSTMKSLWIKKLLDSFGFGKSKTGSKHCRQYMIYNYNN